MENKKRKKTLLWIFCSILAFLLILVISLFIMKKVGILQLKKDTVNQVPELPIEETEEGWEEGWVRYNGEPHAYNQDILTFLVMGIDSPEPVAKAKDGISGGQADALFLVVMDPHDKSVNVVAMNRNIMAAVDVYDRDGKYLGEYEQQIALQHGYGDGMQLSCTRTVNAVSRMFYNIPVHGYVSVNMGTVRELNAAVGGVKLTVLEDVHKKTEKGNVVRLNKGDLLTLTDDEAYVYVCKRDHKEFDSASGRVERQKQYLNEFVSLAKKKVQEDLSFAVDLYNAIQRYMVTDIEMSEFIYLVTEVLGYEFNADNLYTLQGETVMGEAFEEVYLDEDAFYELVMGLFYEPVKN